MELEQDILYKADEGCFKLNLKSLNDHEQHECLQHGS